MRNILVAIALLGTPVCAFAADDSSVKKNANQMFTTCDGNNDGKVSKEEYTNEKMEKFAKYDANKDGALSKEEHEKMAVDLHDKLMG